MSQLPSSHIIISYHGMSSFFFQNHYGDDTWQITSQIMSWEQ